MNLFLLSWLVKRAQTTQSVEYDCAKCDARGQVQVDCDNVCDADIGQMDDTGDAAMVYSERAHHIASATSRMRKRSQ